MAVSVKVTREDFEESFSDGWVDGQVQGRSGVWVYVELGKEVEYIPRPSDNPKTDYKCFKGCSIFYAKSQEMLEREEWLFTDENITVIIYC
jgi:nicotinamidase-related amidase